MCSPRDATNFIVITHQFTNHKSLIMLLFIKWNMFPQLGVVTTGPPHSECSAAQRPPVGKSGCFFPVHALLFCCTKVKLFNPLLILPDIYNYWLFPFWLLIVKQCQKYSDHKELCKDSVHGLLQACCGIQTGCSLFLNRQ